jgi:RNA polymerase sigma factor (sigma-70 family)
MNTSAVMVIPAGSGRLTQEDAMERSTHRPPEVLDISLEHLQAESVRDAEVTASTTALVAGAVEGDERSWELLVKRYAGRVWSVVRTYQLNDSDSADVVATTWLRLVQNLKRIREPEAIGAWLAITTKRECLRLLRRNRRERLTDDLSQYESADRPEDEPEARTLLAERDLMVLESMDGLSERCQALLRALLVNPPLSYKEIGAMLGMPTGSIGPTRARCVECLRRRIARHQPSMAAV